MHFISLLQLIQRTLMELSKFSLLIFTLITTTSVPNFVSAQFNSFTYKTCGDVTYTPNSTYQSNLKSLLNSLSNDNRVTHGFYNFSVGQDPDRVSAFVLCRGYVPANRCRGCVQNSASLITSPENCPNQKQAFGFSEYCSIYYSNGSISGKIQYDLPPWFVTDSNVISNTGNFNESLYSLMNSLQNKAASGDSTLKYATGEANFTGGQAIYGLVQCTPDLSKQTCVDCLQDSFAYFPSCCVKPKASGVKLVLSPSCFVQYDLQNFIVKLPDIPLSPPPPPPTLSTSSTHNISSSPPAVGKSEKSRNITAISISLGVSTLVVISIVYNISLRRKRLRNTWMVKFSKDEMEALDSLQFGLGTIRNATHNFSDDYKLGQGGFGTVHKGVLSDGQEIAVKRLIRNSGQGDAEFKNEILILAKLRHKNLVRLLGFCLHRKEMILIYEFVANRSLDYFIFDKRQPMSWDVRYKIINGIVRGILYLHEESRLNIIHRDLKAANILLDKNFNPKIADFGMARLFNIDHTQTSASRIVGTLGYISPEYALQRQISVKSDVYSFGVLLLEIVSGKTITSFSNDEYQENLLSFAWRNWNAGTAWNLVDPAITSTAPSSEIFRCIHIGLLCVQDNPADRPTMSSIALMLSSYSLTLKAPLQPAFFSESYHLPSLLSDWTTTGNATTTTTRTTTKTSNTSVEASVNGVSVTELYPR